MTFDEQIRAYWRQMAPAYDRPLVDVLARVVAVCNSSRGDPAAVFAAYDMLRFLQALGHPVSPILERYEAAFAQIEALARQELERRCGRPQ